MSSTSPVDEVVELICDPFLGLGLWESGGAWLLLVASLELDG